MIDNNMQQHHTQKNNLNGYERKHSNALYWVSEKKNAPYQEQEFLSIGTQEFVEALAWLFARALKHRELFQQIIKACKNIINHHNNTRKEVIIQKVL